MSITTAAVFCLAMTVFHESRGEPLKGQQAVALVVMNRADWKQERVCGVVRAKHQFPWMTPDLKAPTHRKKAWVASRKVALAVLNGRVKDFTNRSTYFLGKKERPSWRSKVKYVMTIGGHDFFKAV